MTSPNGSDPARADWSPTGPDEVPESGVFLKLLALVGVVSTLALFGFLLVFTLTGGDTRNPDELDQVGFAADALAICGTHQSQILALTPARDVSTPVERAEVLDEANQILSDMIGALRTEIAGRDVVDELPDARSSGLSPSDQAIVDQGTLSAEDATNLDLWLADYDVYLADRITHSARLRQEGDVRFLVTEKEGQPVSAVIDGYARVNDMVFSDDTNPGCAVPLDL